jgi:hypothetical protein
MFAFEQSHYGEPPQRGYRKNCTVLCRPPSLLLRLWGCGQREALSKRLCVSLRGCPPGCIKSTASGPLLLVWHSPCTLTLIPQTTMRLCRRTATGGPLDIEMAREHGMATSPDPMDTVFRTLMAELRAIHDHTTVARRFHQLMGQCTHLEMPVQYERLYLRSLVRQEEPSNDDPRGRQHRRRRRLPHSRV